MPETVTCVNTAFLTLSNLSACTSMRLFVPSCRVGNDITVLIYMSINFCESSLHQGFITEGEKLKIEHMREHM